MFSVHTSLQKGNKMSRVVVFGPNKLRAMKWDNSVAIYLYEKIKMLSTSMRLYDTVGRLMWIQLSWLQLFFGNRNSYSRI